MSSDGKKERKMWGVKEGLNFQALTVAYPRGTESINFKLAGTSLQNLIFFL